MSGSIDNRAASFQHVTAIVNPLSRVPHERIERAFARHAPREAVVRLIPSIAARDAIDITRKIRDEVDLVVAVGGDGTVSEVASGLIGSATPLAIVPAGSTNIVARELGIPANTDQAVALIFTHHRLVRRDLGRCGDRVFLHIAGAGFDARFFARTDNALKRRIGWLAYLPAAVEAWQEHPTQFAITADDQVFELAAQAILIANGGSVIHPRIRLHPGIFADDGWLNVLAVPASPLDAAAAGVAALAGDSRSPWTSIAQCREAIVSATPSVPLQLDGDVVGETPASFNILPGALEIVAPRLRGI